MPLKYSLHRLEAFKTIIESGSILAASRSLRIAQPQLTRTVQLIEEELGCEILIRSRTGVAPTLQGQRLYLFAKSVLADTELTEREIRGHSSIDQVIRIGTYDSIARYVFPSFLRYLFNVHPKLKGEIVASRSSTIIDQVRLKKLDLAIVVETRNIPKEVEAKTLYRDAFSFYSRPSIESRFKSTLISFPDSITTFEGEKYLQIEKKFDNQIRVDNLETVRSLTEEGLGIGVLPYFVARQPMIEGRLVRTTVPGVKKKPVSIAAHSIILIRNREANGSVDIVSQDLERFLEDWI